jgi:thioredoxin-like negative regulator of GroEL
MSQKFEYSVILFYSDFNQASLNTKIALNEVIEAKKHNKDFKIKVNEVNYDQEKDLRQNYDITGVPALLIFLNQELVGRHLGEVTAEEFDTILQHHFGTWQKEM